MKSILCNKPKLDRGSYLVSLLLKYYKSIYIKNKILLRKKEYLTCIYFS